MKNTFPPEIHQRTALLYQEQHNEYPTQPAAIVSIACRFGYTLEKFHT